MTWNLNHDESRGSANNLEEVIADARPNLSRKEVKALEELIADYPDVFETKSGDHRCTEVYHRIDTSGTWPI
jgi:hypothetical protein